MTARREIRWNPHKNRWEFRLRDNDAWARSINLSELSLRVGLEQSREDRESGTIKLVQYDEPSISSCHLN